ncbi:MAG: hypothetical protein ACNA8W_04830 [Bradymonadaceae bacterium]
MNKQYIGVVGLWAVMGLAACATQTGERQVIGMDAERTATNCVQGHAIGGSVQFETCLVPSRGRDMVPMGEMHQPQVATIVRTPVVAFSNPTRWSVEVRRDGALVIRRQLDGLLQDVRDEDEFIEFHSETPLGEMEEIEPGTYEIIYFSEDDEEPTSTTTIVVGEDPTD